MTVIHVPAPQVEKTPADLIADWRAKRDEFFPTNQAIADAFGQCADDLERLLAGKIVTP
jgi:hypothetical protein